MSRPADAEGRVAEKLKEYWAGLVKHEKDFATGDDQKFYELVGNCVDELWEQVKENTWQTQWKDVVVWHKVGLEPAEAERRIREHVRPWLQQARRLKYTRWWVTQGVDGIGEYVDAWFGGEEKGGARERETTTKQTAAERSAENMQNMLAELKGLVEKYAKG